MFECDGSDKLCPVALLMYALKMYFLNDSSLLGLGACFLLTCLFLDEIGHVQGGMAVDNLSLFKKTTQRQIMTGHWR